MRTGTRADTHISVVLKTGPNGHEAFVRASLQKSKSAAYGSYVTTLILLCNVVRKFAVVGNGLSTILPSVTLGLSQSSLSQGGSSGVTVGLYRPVTFPQTVILRLWLLFLVSKVAPTYSGTHCSSRGLLSLIDSSRQLSNLLRRTAAAGCDKSDRHARERSSLRLVPGRDSRLLWRAVVVVMTLSKCVGVGSRLAPGLGFGFLLLW